MLMEAEKSLKEYGLKRTSQSSQISFEENVNLESFTLALILQCIVLSSYIKNRMK